MSQDSTASALDPRQLARSAARGAAMQSGAVAVSRLVLLATTAILARSLTPDQYGLVTLALVIMAYAETVADGGIAQALVVLTRRPSIVRASLAITLGFGVLLAVLLVALAPLFAAWFKQPELTALLQASSLVVVGASLCAVPESLLRKDMRFSAITTASIVRAIVTGAVTMGLALGGAGVWSLIVGSIAASFAYAISCWVLLRDSTPWRFWRWGRADFREVTGFGLPAAGSQIISRFNFEVDYLIVAAFLGTAALGTYQLAFRLPEFGIVNTLYILTAVLYPLYAKAQSEPGLLRRSYLLGLRVQTIFGVTAGIGLATVAPALVPLLFGDGWLMVIEPLIVLSLYAAVRSLGSGINEVYKAIGRPGLAMRLSAAQLFVFVGVLIAGAHFGGIMGVAVGQLVVVAVFVVVKQAVAIRIMGLRTLDVLRSYLPAMVCGAAVALIGFGLWLVPMDATLRAGITVAVAVSVVWCILRFGFTATYSELIGLLRRER
ncbi:lipopolysaccharide biosynthesis protein [Pseudoclavibacter helvolus]|uniref:lipopolysaccharide biosynthesis protein n=1 Tax=Pseudoclavibacter helvolus TaxID=255205 RepID=UPI0024AD6798|nr:lipopolysaccharide biosynthesis protein [Pseudoclavibacter helvolus]